MVINTLTVYLPNPVDFLGQLLYLAIAPFFFMEYDVLQNMPIEKEKEKEK